MIRQLIAKLNPDIVIVIILLVHASSQLILLLQQPHIWPDEALFADMALHRLQDGNFGTNLWDNSVPGITRLPIGLPPVFFNILAFWFSVVGFSIVNQRILSVLIGYITVYIFYRIGKLFHAKQSWYPLLITGILVLDSTMQQAMRISRPEIVVLCFSLGSVYLFFLILNKESSRNRIVFVFFSGLLASLAFLTHYVGAFVWLATVSYYLIKEKWGILKSKEVYIFVGSFLLPILVWFISIIPVFDIFKAQFVINASNRDHFLPWIILLFFFGSASYMIVSICYWLISILIGGVTVRRFTDQGIYVSCLVVAVWLFCLVGKSLWYYSYITVAAYLALNVLIGMKVRKRMVLCIVICLITMNTYRSALSLRDGFIHVRSYSQYVRSIQQTVPADKVIFISAIPSPYYALYDLKSSQQNLYQFPSVRINKEDYVDMLNKTEYVIFNGIHDYVMGDLLLQYLKLNSASIRSIGEDTYYKAHIIRLVPQASRRSPFRSDTHPIDALLIRKIDEFRGQ